MGWQQQEHGWLHWLFEFIVNSGLDLFTCEAASGGCKKGFELGIIMIMRESIVFHWSGFISPWQNVHQGCN